MNPSPFAPSAAAHIGFIGLDNFSGLAADSVLVGTYHASAKLVKYLEGSFVPRQSQLPLELDCRHTGCLAGNQVGRPEPNRERRVRVIHDGASSEGRVTSAVPTAKQSKTRGEVSRLISHPAERADEPVDPPSPLKIGCACCLIRKESLKFRKRTWKRQVVSFENVKSHDRSTEMQILNILPLVGGCKNRISTLSASRPLSIIEAGSGGPSRFFRMGGKKFRW